MVRHLLHAQVLFNLCSADILDGTHAFSVIAQDKVGNIMSTPLLFNWTVDTVAPSTNINMAIDGNNETLVTTEVRDRLLRLLHFQQATLDQLEKME